MNLHIVSGFFFYGGTIGLIVIYIILPIINYIKERNGLVRNRVQNKNDFQTTNFDISYNQNKQNESYSTNNKTKNFFQIEKEKKKINKLSNEQVNQKDKIEDIYVKTNQINKNLLNAKKNQKKKENNFKSESNKNIESINYEILRLKDDVRKIERQLNQKVSNKSELSVNKKEIYNHFQKELMSIQREIYFAIVKYIEKDYNDKINTFLKTNSSYLNNNMINKIQNDIKMLNDEFINYKSKFKELDHLIIDKISNSSVFEEQKKIIQDNYSSVFKEIQTVKKENFSDIESIKLELSNYSKTFDDKTSEILNNLHQIGNYKNEIDEIKEYVSRKYETYVKEFVESIKNSNDSIKAETDQKINTLKNELLKNIENVSAIEEKDHNFDKNIKTIYNEELNNFKKEFFNIIDNIPQIELIQKEIDERINEKYESVIEELAELLRESNDSLKAAADEVINDFKDEISGNINNNPQIEIIQKEIDEKINKKFESAAKELAELSNHSHDSLKMETDEAINVFKEEISGKINNLPQIEIIYKEIDEKINEKFESIAKELTELSNEKNDNMKALTDEVINDFKDEIFEKIQDIPQIELIQKEIDEKIKEKFDSIAKELAELSNETNDNIKALIDEVINNFKEEILVKIDNVPQADLIQKEIDEKFNENYESVIQELAELSKESNDTLKAITDKVINDFKEEILDKIQNIPQIEIIQKKIDEKINAKYESIIKELAELSKESNDNLKAITDKKNNNFKEEILNKIQNIPQIDLIQKEIEEKYETVIEELAELSKESNDSLKAENDEIINTFKEEILNKIKNIPQIEIIQKEFDEKYESMEKNLTEKINQKDKSIIYDLTELIRQSNKSLKEATDEVIKDFKEEILEMIKNTPQIGDIKDYISKFLEKNPDIINLIVDKQTNFSNKIIDLEQKTLIETWKRFKEKNIDIVEYSIKAKKSEDYSFFGYEVANKLPELLSSHSLLFEKTRLLTSEIKDYYSRINSIYYINDTINENNYIKTVEDKDLIKEIFKIRRFNQLINELYKVEEAQKIYDFRPINWIREKFIDYSDYFIIEFQKAEVEGNQSLLIKPYEIICKTLSKANIEPVEISLWKTQFNSSIHIARSTVKEYKKPNGVIASVIRNGFKYKGGNYYRQPEVIVNKL